MHDLFSQMERLSQNLSRDYQDIRARYAKNKNTEVAGAAAVKAWAKVLSGLLPSQYKVFTNGTIISSDDRTSPEIDILVVKGEHPQHLLEQNVFLAAGVAAAFECKLTLSASDIKKYLEVCKKVKNLCPARFGTPYRELQSPIIYGLLALSHPWKKRSAKPDKRIVKELSTLKSVNELGWHPRHFIDLISVADLNTWVVSKVVYHHVIKDANSGLELAFSQKAAAHISMKHTPFVAVSYGDISYARKTNEKPTYSILGFSANLMNMLAREDIVLRDMANYYRLALSDPPGSRRFPPGKMGFSMKWDYAVLSEHVRNAFSTNDFEYETEISDEKGTIALNPYDEWTGAP